MSSEAAITVNGVSKAYLVYAKPIDRLKQALLPRVRSLARPIAGLVGRDAAPTAYFRRYEALQPLSFEVARGETVGIIGQNGSGKSTLLKLICNTIEPTTGDVVTRGRLAALLELGSGFNPEYTGRENIMLNASVLGLSTEATLERMDDILAFADIGDFIDQPIRTYSSGMAMRLAFAVIAHVDAEILVIDEALAVGDIYFQQKCLRWLRDFRERGTVLFCGHDTGALINLCRRALWLHAGALRMEGEAKAVAEAYTAFMHGRATGLSDAALRVRPNRSASAVAPATTEAETPGPTPQGAEPPAVRPAPSPRPVPPAPPVDRPVVFDWMAESSSFGNGAAQITRARLLFGDGREPDWIEGGEDVVISLEAEVRENVVFPIAGFIVKDRLGQAVTGTNTATAGQPLSPMAAGETVAVDFAFRLPLLSSGRYTITVALADGTLDAHVQLHWIHDAVLFDVHSRHGAGVIVAPEIHHVAARVLRPASSCETCP